MCLDLFACSESDSHRIQLPAAWLRSSPRRVRLPSAAGISSPGLPSPAGLRRSPSSRWCMYSLSQCHKESPTNHFPRCNTSSLSPSPSRRAAVVARAASAPGKSKSNVRCKSLTNSCIPSTAWPLFAVVSSARRAASAAPTASSAVRCAKHPDL